MTRKIRIRRVIDGDSLEVKYAGLFSFMRRPFPVRLYGIDAPELAQPYGRESREQLASLVRRGGLRMETKATDRYGRTVWSALPPTAQPRVRQRRHGALRHGLLVSPLRRPGFRLSPKRKPKRRPNGAACGKTASAPAAPGTTAPTCANPANVGVRAAAGSPACW